MKYYEFPFINHCQSCYSNWNTYRKELLLKISKMNEIGRYESGKLRDTGMDQETLN